MESGPLADALAWFQADRKGRSYKAAAAKFGVDVGELRKFAKGSSRTRAHAKAEVHALPAPTVPPMVEFFTRQVGELQADLDLARRTKQLDLVSSIQTRLHVARLELAEAEAAAAAVSVESGTPIEQARRDIETLRVAIERQKIRPKQDAQGLGALLRLLERAEEKLARLMAAEPDQLDGMSAEEVAEHVQHILTEWTDAHLEIAMRVYGERHGARIIVVRDGHRAELTDEGWTAGAVG